MTRTAVGNESDAPSRSSESLSNFVEGPQTTHQLVPGLNRPTATNA